MKLIAKLFSILALFQFSPAFAQDPSLAPLVNEDFLEGSVINDNNGSGSLEVLAFGDSITRGVGDFNAVGSFIESVSPEVVGEAGYPLRIEALFGISVANNGSPGEELIDTGLKRFASAVTSQRPDIAIILEGANDAIFNKNDRTYFRKIQAAINIARATGAEPVLLTPTPTCCDREGRGPLINTYASRVREIAALNDVPLADTAKAFTNACGSSDCFLLNRPEGLHPNSAGYDVISEVVAATLLRINIFAEDGRARLEEALNLQEGSVKTVPDPVPVTEE